jgi:Novel STAND NTPase 1
VSEHPDQNPYPGPQPFERTDRTLFFGRDREKRELVSLVLAHPVVLLYARSGAGKTSLLNAGVVPDLEGEEGFEVLPSLRIRPAADDPPPPEVANAYVYAVLTNLVRDLGADLDDLRPRLASMSFTDFLAEREQARNTENFFAPRVLVFDQFEELFTVYPEFWAQREAFVRQLVGMFEHENEEVLGPLRIVLALREDHLAELAPYARLMPDGFRIRRRLELLDRTAALEAVTEPMRNTGRSFAPRVAETLVDDLLKQRIEKRPRPDAAAARVWRRRPPSGTVAEIIPGEFVEPVLLQVVCRSLWNRLPAGVTEITAEHLREGGSVDQALRQLYDDAVQTALKVVRAGAVSRSDTSRGTITAVLRAIRVSEGQLRARVEAEFITPLGTRDTRWQGPSATAGIPNIAVEALERERLLRAESARGGRYVELTHDSLIEPIRISNRRYRETRRRITVGVAAVAVAGAAVVVASLLLLTSRGSSRNTSAELNVSPLGIRQAIRPDVTGFLVTLSSGKLDFGPIPINESEYKSIVLASGAERLKISAVESSSEDFAVSASCNTEVPLPAHRTCPITVAFAPLTPGRKDAVLRVTRQDGSPLKVVLNGTGVRR